jgi:hypothetical protein
LDYRSSLHRTTAATAPISTNAPGTPNPATRAAVTKAGSSDASSDAIALVSPRNLNAINEQHRRLHDVSDGRANRGQRRLRILESASRANRVATTSTLKGRLSRQSSTDPENLAPLHRLA